jgi:hypothetical protein
VAGTAPVVGATRDQSCWSRSERSMSGPTGPVGHRLSKELGRILRRTTQRVLLSLARHRQNRLSMQAVITVRSARSVWDIAIGIFSAIDPSTFPTGQLRRAGRYHRRERIAPAHAHRFFLGCTGGQRHNRLPLFDRGWDRPVQTSPEVSRSDSPRRKPRPTVVWCPCVYGARVRPCSGRLEERGSLRRP